MSNHYVTMQSAWYPWGPPWQQAHFQTSAHPHVTNGKRLPTRRQTCSIEHTLCNTSSDSLHVSRAAQVDQPRSNLTEESVCGTVCSPRICVGSVLQVIWNMHVWHLMWPVCALWSEGPLLTAVSYSISDRTHSCFLLPVFFLNVRKTHWVSYWVIWHHTAHVVHPQSLPQSYVHFNLVIVLIYWLIVTAACTSRLRDVISKLRKAEKKPIVIGDFFFFFY